eukprot:63946-Amphidinium_carterae.3
MPVVLNEKCFARNPWTASHNKPDGLTSATSCLKDLGNDSLAVMTQDFVNTIIEGMFACLMFWNNIALSTSPARFVRYSGRSKTSGFSVVRVICTRETRQERDELGKNDPGGGSACAAGARSRSRTNPGNATLRFKTICCRCGIGLQWCVVADANATTTQFMDCHIHDVRHVCTSIAVGRVV